MAVGRIAWAGLCLVAAAGCARKAAPAGGGDSEAGAGPVAATTVTGGDCRRTTAAAAFKRVGDARESSAVALAEAFGRKVALVADEDARALVVLDFEQRTELASTPLEGRPASLLVAPDGGLLVTLRDLAKVVVLDAGADVAARLTPRCAVAVAPEPLALALTPDDRAVLLTSGWGHTVAGFDAATLATRWSLDVPREPRAVLVAADGKRAFVAHAVGARVSEVELGDKPSLKDVDLRPEDARPRTKNETPAVATCQGYALTRVASPGSRVLAPAVLVNTGDRERRTTGYGEANASTEEAIVAVLDEATGAAVGRSLWMTARDRRAQPDTAAGECLLPRAAAVDSKSRTLLVACFGIDAVVAYDALAPSPADAPLRRYAVGGGPSGIAVDPASGKAAVWSQFDRTLSIIEVRDVDPLAELEANGPPVERVKLAPVYANADAYKWAIGRQLFHSVGDGRISQDGRACASCHPDGRDDALTWATPDGPRRTPMLAGRLKDSAPYGWTGASRDLPAHLVHTFERLHGAGLSGLELDALLTYVQSLEPPAATPSDPGSVARGGAIFHSKDAACASCHHDASAFTDGQNHNVGSRAGADRTASFDTPSLRFVGARGPYFHDGRFATLAALLKGTRSTMGNTEHLRDAEYADLEAYLRSL